MTNAQSPDSYLGRDVVDPQGDKIGSVGQVYVNDQSGRPDWITVKAGLFGTKEKFVPLEGSRFDGDNLVLPFEKSVVKGAPEVEDAAHLDVDESAELYSYYQGYRGGGQTTDTGMRSETETRTTTETTRGAGHDTSGPNTDDAMTRSEERLKVGTQQVETGRAKLRKYVVTEQQTVNVPVSHEEVRLEREPITDANRDQATSGADISEEEHEVVLHAEEPVVTKEAVPVERVRLGTETVTEQQAVSGEVRKEQVDVDNGSGTGRHGRDADNAR